MLEIRQATVMHSTNVIANEILKGSNKIVVLVGKKKRKLSLPKPQMYGRSAQQRMYAIQSAQNLIIGLYDNER